MTALSDARRKIEQLERAGNVLDARLMGKEWTDLADREAHVEWATAVALSPDEAPLVDPEDE